MITLLTSHSRKIVMVFFSEKGVREHGAEVRPTHKRVVTRFLSSMRQKCFATFLWWLPAFLLVAGPVSSAVQLERPESKHHRAFTQIPVNKGKLKKYPLGSIFYTYHQKGAKLLRQGQGDEKFRPEMRQLFISSRQIGASNVFLAQGDTISDAVKATWCVFSIRETADQPAATEAFSKSKHYWFVAFLGVSGSHGEWLLKGVSRNGKTIRLSYERNTDGGKVLDLLPYFAWVPLDHLEPGTYVLELYDVRRNHVSLLRRVNILKRNR